jgi:hypothetical protein
VPSVPSATPTSTATYQLKVAPRCTITEEERAAVEEAIYKSLLFELDGNTSLIVLDQRRTLDEGDQLTSGSWPWLSNDMSLLPQELFADYLSINRNPPDLPTDLHLVTPYYFIDTYTPQSWEQFWTLFHTRFRSASGYWVVSRVGVNCSRDRALVYVAHATPGGADLLPGWRAILYLLSLSEGEWDITQWTFVSQT